MSPNNPYLPDDGNGNENEHEKENEHVPPQRDNQSAARDPLANNPYSNQQRQAEAPDLDAGAPSLRSSEMTRMNRRAMMFLVAIVVLLVFLAVWVLKASHHDDNKPKVREETLTVPQAPPPVPVAPPAPRPLPKLPEPIQLTDNAPPPLPKQTKSMPDLPRGPTLMERRMAADSAAQMGDANGVSGLPPAPAGFAAAPQRPGLPGQSQDMWSRLPGLSGQQQAPLNSPVGLPNLSSAQPLYLPDTLMQRGTYIRCVLETRIISDIPGFTSCIVTEPVYSFNGKRLLLPKGSKVLGKYDMGPVGDRMAVIWDRILTPTGIDVNMASPGIDNLGGSGHPGYLNNHWPSRIGAALLISMLSDAFAYEAAKHGPQTETVGIGSGTVTATPFQSNTAQTLQNLAQQAVRSAANRPGTVTINQGTILYVYVAKDVDFSGVVARF
ncbi:MAG TPA: TrbI/VirB10 family protein [Dyella sp.]|uniref:TrbI/VirB10 family protein n=1 Tax=Dyella sp. TaxID=1869338 RepID=UPI002F91EB83